MTSIRSIKIEFTDGSYLEFNDYQLSQLEKLSDAMMFIDRARQLYKQLEPVFSKEKKK